MFFFHLYKNKNHQLGYEYSKEHSKRIHSRIRYGRLIVGSDGIGISQSWRIGRGAG